VELTHVGDASHAPQGVLVDGGGAVTDACLQLALRVRKALLDRDARTLAVVSATRNEGKTTVSCNLALAMASLGQVGRVALVDLDLRRPSIATVLELVTPACGIEDALARGEPLTSARIHVSSPDLDVYPCLRGHPRAHELLLDPHFSELVAELRQAYDVVVFDTPPTLLVPDATIVMEHVDCFAPVARAGVSRVRNFKKILETLPRGRMLGVILDGGATSMRKGYYDHYAPDAVEAQAAAGEAEEVAHGG
jgi:capsular exopolysaccharide synthesis family protein